MQLKLTNRDHQVSQVNGPQHLSSSTVAFGLALSPIRLGLWATDCPHLALAFEN